MGKLAGRNLVCIGIKGPDNPTCELLLTGCRREGEGQEEETRWRSRSSWEVYMYVCVSGCGCVGVCLFARVSYVKVHGTKVCASELCV